MEDQVNVELFGSTLRETTDFFLGARAGSKRKGNGRVLPGDTSKADAGYIGTDENDRLKIWARIAVSVIVTVGGCVMLMAGNAQAQQAGAGFIGLVVGYWLR